MALVAFGDEIVKVFVLRWFHGLEPVVVDDQEFDLGEALEAPLEGEMARAAFRDPSIWLWLVKSTSKPARTAQCNGASSGIGFTVLLLQRVSRVRGSRLKRPV